MKKLVSLITIALLTVTMLASCGQKDNNAGTTDNENKTLKIGYTIYEPMNYMEDGELTGFETEFANAVCEKIGYTPEFVEINWDTKFVTLDSKKIDCIWNGMTISDDVKANCIISDAYVKNAQVVVMEKDKLDSYKDAESLKGLKFTAEAGSTGEEAIKDAGLDENYNPVAAQTDALLAVAGGQADACVIDITMANSMTAEGTSYEDLGYTVELTSEEYGIGFRKDDTQLRDDVNKAIKELNEDGTLPELAEKYNLTLLF